MAVQFKAAPLPALDLREEEEKIYTLSLQESPDSVVWSLDPRECGIDFVVDENNPCRVTLKVQSGAGGIVLLNYTIKVGEDEYSGYCTIRLNAGCSGKTKNNQPAASVWRKPETVTPAPAPVNQQVEEPTLPADSLQLDRTQGKIPDDCHLLSLQIRGNEVLCIVRGREYKLGRESAALQFKPDLAFDPFFESEELKKQCSREQATICWTGNNIQVECTGRSPLYLVDEHGNGVERPRSFFWKPGEILGFPGGITLRLVLP